MVGYLVVLKEEQSVESKVASMVARLAVSSGKLRDDVLVDVKVEWKVVCLV